jgi:hypothetical protein
MLATSILMYQCSAVPVNALAGGVTAQYRKQGAHLAPSMSSAPPPKLHREKEIERDTALVRRAPAKMSTHFKAYKGGRKAFRSNISKGAFTESVKNVGRPFKYLWQLKTGKIDSETFKAMLKERKSQNKSLLEELDRATEAKKLAREDIYRQGRYRTQAKKEARRRRNSKKRM